MSLVLLLLSLAFADEPVDDGGAALAIPASPPGPLTEAQLAKLREYRAQHFSVRTEVHTTGGGSRVWSPPPYGWGGAVVSQQATVVTRTWAVYEGDQRVNVPHYLELAGQDEQRRDLMARVTMKRWLGRCYYGAAAAGVGAVVFSAVAVNSTSDDATKNSYEKFGATGLAVAVVGLIGGSIPTAHAARLETDYAVSNIDIGSAQELVDAQNEDLRVELGVTPAEAFQVESTTPALAPPDVR